MDSLDDNELPLIEQLFRLQLDLENELKAITEDNDHSIDSQSLVYRYLDNVLDNKLLTIDDFGNDVDWLNVSKSISIRKDLNGLVVVIDFFTYCCINCLHILPKLRLFETELESKAVAVIGVHSPKFDNEKDISNVCDAVLKYNIDHPIANDPTGKVWSSLSVQCWPTLLILGPKSQILFQLIGENGVNDWLDFYTKTSLKYFEQKNLLIKENKSKIPIKLLRNTFDAKLLGFPSKISASVDQQLIAISNPRYHNIIIAKNNGIIRHKIGGNESGFRDGLATSARFNAPNGLVWINRHTVCVADTENHAIRRIDINSGTVVTLVGNGKQTEDRKGGKIGSEQGLNSPWDLCYDQKNRLFIAMAGSHQIWVLILEDNAEPVLGKSYPKNCCFCFAGNGAEQNRNNSYPQNASFAQPSGLAFDSKNNCLFVADSESSSIRRVDISTGCVSAVVGGDRNPENLFAFGDIDGKGINCRLQHCLGITFDDINECLFVADSYNHKIKKIKVSTKDCISIAGNGVKGNAFECKLMDSSFNEPNGLCLLNGSKNILLTDTNNHCLKLLDLEKDFVNEFQLINANERTKTYFNEPTNETKFDSTFRLNSIDLSRKNGLKFKLNLKFGSHIKATNGAKHTINFKNPDESLFSTTHKDMKIESFDEISQFSLTLNEKQFNECLNKCFDFIINITFNVCNIDLNFCKQIRVSFILPILICDNETQNILTQELCYNFVTSKST